MRQRLGVAAPTLLAVVVALAWTALIGRMHVAGLASPIDRFEEVCLDLRFLLAPTRPPPGDVVIVAIDDGTVRRAGAYPLPRADLASIVQGVARRHPRAIGLDVLLLDPGPPEGDTLLSQSLQPERAVIAAAAVFGDMAKPLTHSLGPLSALPKPTGVLWPREPFAGAAEIGLVNLSTGFGGVPRHVPLLFEGGNGVVSSFVLLAAALASGEAPVFAAEHVSMGQRRIPLDLGQNLVLRHYGPRGTIPSVSALAFEGADPPDLSKRIALIGATAVGAGDSFPTPFSAVVPGVEILATGIDNLMAGDALVRTTATRWIDVAAAAILAVGAVLLIAVRRSIVGLGLALLLATAWVGLSFLAFCEGYWVSTALPLTAMTPTAILFGAARLWQERRTTSRLTAVERGLRPFQPRQLVDILAKDPAFLAEPQIQNAAVLFVDLSGYTTLSETGDPVRMRDLLKSFHGLIDRIVGEHGGLVVNFMGDGAMALFGFPSAQNDDALRALSALNDLGAHLRAWGSPERTGLERPIQARLSAHYGSVVLSRLGGDTHQQITVTGDTVNVASRFLEVAKEAHVPAVISDRISRAAGPRAPLASFSETVERVVRGRNRPVSVRLSLSVFGTPGQELVAQPGQPAPPRG